MSCEELSEELSAYVDDELSPAERERLEAHLQGCDRCRLELQSLHTVSRLVASLPQVEPAPAFADAIKAQLRPPRRRWLRPISPFVGDLVPALAVAAVLLIAVTVTFVLPYLGGLRRQTQPLAEQARPASSPVPREAVREPDIVRERLDEIVIVGKGGVPKAPADVPDGLLVGEAEVRQLVARKETSEAVALFDDTREAPEPETLSRMGRPEGALAFGESMEGMKQSFPEMSAAVRHMEEEHIRAPVTADREELETVGDAKALPRVTAAKAGAPVAPRLPGFYTIFLHCTDTAGGRRAFDKVVLGFQDLSQPPPPFASHWEMTKEESRRYGRLLHQARHSPETILYKEVTVLQGYPELVRAAFPENVALSFDDEGADVERLQAMLAQLRRLAELPAAEDRAARERGRGIGADVEEARRLYEQNLEHGFKLGEVRRFYEWRRERQAEPKLVRVLVVLKRQPRAKPEAPAQTEEPVTRPQ